MESKFYGEMLIYNFTITQCNGIDEEIYNILKELLMENLIFIL